LNQHQKLAIEALRDFESYHLNAIESIQANPAYEKSCDILRITKQDAIKWHIEKSSEIQAAIEWIKTIGGNDDTI
jgi:hypothetical protein